MNIYNYDSDGVFIFESIASSDPLEQGRFLIPANATTEAPPTTGLNEAAVFSGSWSVVPDYRGITYYLKEDNSEVSFNLGEEPDLLIHSEAEVVIPEPEKTPEELDLIARHERRVARESSLGALTHDFGDGRVMQVRPKDEQNIRNAIEIMTLNSMPSIDWVMLDDIKYAVTVSELQTALLSGQTQALTIWENFNP